MKKTVRILFSGYAHVHYLCFRPIYERIRRLPGVEVYFSGGTVRRNAEGGKDHDVQALYRPFRLPKDRILPIPKMQQRTFDMVFCAHTKGFFPKRRCPRVQIFHGVSFRNASVRTRQRDYDHFFVVGPYQLRALRAQGVIEPGDRRAVPIGFPKLDPLFDGSLSRRAILRSVGLKGDRPVVLYAPTGQKHNSLETMGEEVIERLRKDDRIDLLVKPHDHPKNQIDWFKRLRRLEGRHVRLIRDLDVVPWLFASDALISDASSVASEYTVLDRPILFLDVPKLIAQARTKKGMLDLKTHGRKIGLTVRRPKEIVRAVAGSLAHPNRRSSHRRAAARDLFYNPGGATDAAIEWVLRRLKRRASLRATG